MNFNFTVWKIPDLLFLSHAKQTSCRCLVLELNSTGTCFRMIFSQFEEYHFNFDWESSYVNRCFLKILIVTLFQILLRHRISLNCHINLSTIWDLSKFANHPSKDRITTPTLSVPQSNNHGFPLSTFLFSLPTTLSSILFLPISQQFPQSILQHSAFRPSFHCLISKITPTHSVHSNRPLLWAFHCISVDCSEDLEFHSVTVRWFPDNFLSRSAQHGRSGTIWSENEWWQIVKTGGYF
jgi:hypothetical protein